MPARSTADRLRAQASNAALQVVDLRESLCPPARHRPARSAPPDWQYITVQRLRIELRVARRQLIQRDVLARRR